VHELDREHPKATKELLDIATRHASSKEAVGAVFVQSNGKTAPSGGREASAIVADKGTKMGVMSGKRGTKRWPQWVAVTTSCDEGNNDKDVGDSDEELIAPTEPDFKHQARLPTDHFEKLLKATCSNHTYLVKHKLKECTLKKNYMTTGTFPRSKKTEGDSAGKIATPFAEEKAGMSIYDGPTPHESCHKLKLTGQAINAMSAIVPDYLRRSESPITFDQTNNPNSIPKPGRFLLIVDPLVGTTRLTESLMDRASGLNLMYLSTFVGLGLT
jgi:hypothetical protein